MTGTFMRQNALLVALGIDRKSRSSPRRRPATQPSLQRKATPGRRNQESGTFVLLCLALVGLVAGGSPVSAQTPDDFNPGADNFVWALAEQPDGKILVGGQFTSLDGTTRNSLGRLDSDGNLDSNFTATANSTVYSLALQPDRKILVGGAFTNLCGQPRNYLGRLNADGTLDTNFNASANSGIYSLALQPDGKILVGGSFTSLCGQPRNFLGRLYADGTLDTNFNASANSVVFSLVLQADGKILVGGAFTNLCGQARNYLGRLNSDGSLDTNFTASANAAVYDLGLQADGKILVAGTFTTLSGQSRARIGRLTPDGILDSGFNPGANATIATLVVQADGKILVGGDFTNLGGQTRLFLGRLNPDGLVDTNFNLSASSSVFALSAQSDGKVLAGGAFATLGGQPRGYIGRLNNTDPATHTLTYDGLNLLLQRGGTSPEVWRTSFEFTTNGAGWASLGAGTRVAGGWQLATATLPAHVTVRARGYTTGGGLSGSSWYCEDYWGDLLLLSSPESHTNIAGTSATLGVAAAGTTPLSFQWLKDSVPVADGGVVTGAVTSKLKLNSVSKLDEGDYSVVITNNTGAITSLVARLTVLDPFITVQPTSQSSETNGSVTFTATVAGTLPTYYRWLKDGIPLAKGTNATLVLTNLQGADAGNYSLVVSNGFGSITSVMAVLTVNLAPTELAFTPQAGGTYPWVNSLAVQADGRILLGGLFTRLNGATHSYLGRLNANGSLDTGFTLGANDEVLTLAVRADEKILVGGYFTKLGGQTRNYLGRLNADGTLDPNFNPGADFWVNCLAVQADGNILVGGNFSTLGGQTRSHLGRLYADGTLDPNFNPGANGQVNTLATQPDGKIVVGGVFTSLSGQSRTNIGRLNPNGSLDTNFTAAANGAVSSLVVQSDGKILVGGSFTTFGGQTRSNLVRLNADGSVDPDFNPGVNGLVESLALQANGSILVGGRFTSLGGQTRNFLGRLNADGSLDLNFNPGANFYVTALALPSDGKILVGGYFGTLGGQTHEGIGRLINTSPATQTLSYDGWNLSWQRAGTSPEVWRTTFEFTTNSVDWISLGAGTRVAGGWQLTAGSLPALSTVRARGFVTGGCQNSSSWFCEKLFTIPVSGGTAPAVFSLSANAYSVTESGGTVQVTVLKNSNGTNGVVNFSTADGTAVAVSSGVGNYTNVAGSLNFAAHELSKTITIGIRDNGSYYTGARTFNFSLQPSGDGSTVGSPGIATITILDNDSPPSTNSVTLHLNVECLSDRSGAMTVFLVPTNSGGQWRLAREITWRSSGSTVSNLTSGSYEVLFKPVAGFATPPSLTVVVPSGVPTPLQTNFPYARLYPAQLVGALTINLIPSSGQWRLLGETNWLASGATRTNLMATNHVVEFASLTGYATPPLRTAIVPAGPTNYTVTYQAPDNNNWYQPQAAVFDTGNLCTPFSENYTFNYAGQILTDVGYGSGCVVKQRVVLTAAHVIFDDLTLSYAPNVRWFFQRQAGQYEPSQLLARGSYVSSGYAAARTNDVASLGPGVSSLRSQSQDVAALFFFENAGRGGQSGYLVATNGGGGQWLQSGFNMTLIGYPVEGVSDLERGRLFRTPPMGYTFTALTNGVFATTTVAGHPGMSGGPVCVQVPQFTGPHYPAGVYIGSSQQSIVRAIDGTVADIINRADSDAHTGNNNTGGGVIRITATSSGTTDAAYLQVTVGPPAAVAAGAGWRLLGDTNTAFQNDPNFTYLLFGTDAIGIEFKAVDGWDLPANQAISIPLGSVTNIVANYSLAGPVLVLNPTQGLGITGVTGRVYRIEYRTNLASGSWQPLRTNTLGAGFNQLMSWPPTNGLPAAFYRAVWLP